MAVFVHLGRQRLPFVKGAMVVDVNTENAHRNLENFKNHNIRIVKFGCFGNPDYKYMWTVYKYIGKTDNFAKAIEEMQNRVLLCGYTDYADEVVKMIEGLHECSPDIRVRRIDLKK